MLREDGFLWDDGTTWRLSETQFLMTTTTANAAPVLSQLEFLLAAVWPEMKVAVTSITEQWAGMAVSGPKSRDVLAAALDDIDVRSEEHTSELQSLMRISYAVFCLKKKKTKIKQLPAATY